MRIRQKNPDFGKNFCLKHVGLNLVGRPRSYLDLKIWGLKNTGPEIIRKVMNEKMLSSHYIGGGLLR